MVFWAFMRVLRWVCQCVKVLCTLSSMSFGCCAKKTLGWKGPVKMNHSWQVHNTCVFCPTLAWKVGNLMLTAIYQNLIASLVWVGISYFRAAPEWIINSFYFIFINYLSLNDVLFWKKKFGFSPLHLYNGSTLSVSVSVTCYVTATIEPPS